MDESTYLGPTAAAELAKLAKETAVTVDDRLDAGSTHPVHNKVVTVALNAKAGKDVATSGADGLMSAADKAKLDKMSTDALPTPVLNPTNVQALVVDKYTTAYKLASFDQLELPGAAESTNAPQTRSVKYALDRKASKDAATAEADGLMPAADKVKLDGIETGANKTVVDEALDAASTNPVQNKAVKAALDSKASTVEATTGAAGLMSAADKTKLDGVEAGANETTVDAALDAASENPVQNKVIKAALDSKLSTLGGEISGNLDVGLTIGAGGSVSTGMTRFDSGIHFEKAASDAGRISHGFSEADGEDPPLARLKVAAPTEDDDVTTKQYVDDRAVRHDAEQGLTSDQKLVACANIGAVNQKSVWTEGNIAMLPRGADGSQTINIMPSEKSNDYTLTLDGGPENVPVYVAGLGTPTDAQTDYATIVAYVKAKIAEVAASGGVDVDNALSATSTNPVQNKVITSALTGKAGTAVATESANGLMSKADKTKLDGIAAGANKTTIDSAMSGSSNNPVANHVIKQYIDDKVAAAGSNITVDAALSSTSTNPVQNKAIKEAIDAKADKTALDSKADKSALDAKADKTALDAKADVTALDGKADKTALDGKLSTSGGTLTGNLTGKYITGTWLQTTEATDLGRAPGKIAVLDDSGWVYHRTPAELLADIGAATVSAMLDKAYPVGSIYMSVNSTNPKTLFGGTWVQLKDRFLLAAGTTYKAGATGGEATHTLTASEMPSHNHAVYYPNAGAADHSAPGNYPDGPSDSTYYAIGSYTSSAGGGAAHNNMPPYLSVYVWKRTA